MSESIEVAFTYTRDEYIRAIRRHYQTTLRVRRDLVISLLAFIAGVYLAAATDAGWPAWALAAVGASLCALVAFVLVWLPRMIYNADPKLKSAYWLSFADAGIRFKTEGIDSTIAWSFYRAWKRDDEFYVLYHGRRNLSVIPRRAIVAADADQRLAGLLARHLGSPS